MEVPTSANEEVERLWKEMLGEDFIRVARTLRADYGLAPGKHLHAA